MRLFCGLRLPPEAIGRLHDWELRELRGRIVPPGNLHVTLAFLGSRPAAELPEIARALGDAAAAASPPVLTVTGYRETRSVGMLVLDDRDGRATALAADLHARLEHLGVYRHEERPWLPHVTVLRFRERPHLRPPPPALGEVCPSEAAVYHSLLRPSGAQYDVLEAHALGG